MMRLSLVIPCYNERDGIPHLLEALRDTRALLEPEYELELIFVDDGSRDGTADLLTASCDEWPNAVVLRHPKNLGLGAALRTGFARATGELTATNDSDCTYDPRQLVAMLRRLEWGVDVVVASPYHPDGGVHNVPAYRLFLSRNLSRLYNVVVGTRVYTYTSLFRVYRARVLRDVGVRSDGFLSMAEILVEALLRGYRVVEYPMVLTARRHGTSKAAVLRLIGQHLRFLWHLFGDRARAHLVPQPHATTQGAEPSGQEREIATSTIMHGTDNTTQGGCDETNSELAPRR